MEIKNNHSKGKLKMKNNLIAVDILRQKIFTIRGKKVMLDRDIAVI